MKVNVCYNWRQLGVDNRYCKEEQTYNNQLGNPLGKAINYRGRGCDLDLVF